MRQMYFSFILIFSSCLFWCETDNSRIVTCSEIVKTFLSNLPLDNYDMLFKYYPNFSKIKHYWKINDFRIENTSIDDEKTVSIIGTSSQGNIMFILKKLNANYVIINSKGLASVFNSSLYNYCKEIRLNGDRIRCSIYMVIFVCRVDIFHWINKGQT
jgi:hypothetical protein